MPKLGQHRETEQLLPLTKDYIRKFTRLTKINKTPGRDNIPDENNLD